VDFGIIIDGAVVMVEGLFVMLDHKAHKYGDEKFNKLAKEAGSNRRNRSWKSNFLFKINHHYFPDSDFSFQKVEGKMFSPLHLLGFALMGALIFLLRSFRFFRTSF
jgi:cobalt-zinc-cadmium resistance protein CzcA